MEPERIQEKKEWKVLEGTHNLPRYARLLEMNGFDPQSKGLILTQGNKRLGFAVFGSSKDNTLPIEYIFIAEDNRGLPVLYTFLRALREYALAHKYTHVSWYSSSPEMDSISRIFTDNPNQETIVAVTTLEKFVDR